MGRKTKHIKEPVKSGRRKAVSSPSPSRIVKRSSQKPALRTRRHEPVEVTTDNIFADLGFPDAETHLLKARLVVTIVDLMKQRRMKHAEAARLFNLSQAEMSGMLRGAFRHLPLERLLDFVRALGQDIEIIVTPRPAVKDTSESQSLPLWEEFEQAGLSLPEKVLAMLPSDGASQHDHSIYGIPKRPS